MPVRLGSGVERGPCVPAVLPSAVRLPRAQWTRLKKPVTIEYFADQQNLVFVPALGALLIATVLICLPIVFAPTLRRRSSARFRGVVVAAGVLAGVALVAAGWQAGVGLRTLQAERASVSQQLQDRYRLGLTSGEVGELVNGGAPDKAYPDLASALDLKATRSGEHPLRLRTSGAGGYELTYGGAPVPTAQE